VRPRPCPAPTCGAGVRCSRTRPGRSRCAEAAGGPGGSWRAAAGRLTLFRRGAGPASEPPPACAGAGERGDALAAAKVAALQLQVAAAALDLGEGRGPRGGGAAANPAPGAGRGQPFAKAAPAARCADDGDARVRAAAAAAVPAFAECCPRGAARAASLAAALLVRPAAGPGAAPCTDTQRAMRGGCPLKPFAFALCPGLRVRCALANFLPFLCRVFYFFVL